MMIVAAATLGFPAGATLCVDGDRHLVLEWPAETGPCCDVSTAPGTADACAPGACDTCHDVVLTGTATLSARARSLAAPDLAPLPAPDPSQCPAPAALAARAVPLGLALEPTPRRRGAVLLRL